MNVQKMKKQFTVSQNKNVPISWSYDSTYYSTVGGTGSSLGCDSSKQSSAQTVCWDSQEYQANSTVNVKWQAEGYQKLFDQLYKVQKNSHKKTVHCSTSTTLVPASAGNTPTKFNNTSKTSCGCLRDGRMQRQLVQPSSALTNTKQWHVLQGLFAMWHKHYLQQEITVWTPYFDLAW